MFLLWVVDRTERKAPEMSTIFWRTLEMFKTQLDRSLSSLLPLTLLCTVGLDKAITRPAFLLQLFCDCQNNHQPCNPHDDPSVWVIYLCFCWWGKQTVWLSHPLDRIYVLMEDSELICNLTFILKYPCWWIFDGAELIYVQWLSSHMYHCCNILWLL